MTTFALEANEHRAMLACMNISHAADLWLGELERRNHSDRAIDTYRRLLHKLADEHTRQTDVDDITVVHIRKFLDGQARRRDGQRKSPATIAQNVSIVNNFFDWLAKEGIIGRNPTRRNGDRIISRPKQVRPEHNDNVTTVSGADVMKLLAVANAGEWPARMAVNVAAYAGPRRRALCNLRLRDYDEAGRRLTFQEKGGKTISKPIPDELAHVIEEAIKAGTYESVDDYLVPSQGAQRRPGDRDDRIIWRLVRETAAKAGVTTHVHALRAAFAVQFLENNPGEMIALQELMGHDRPETTLVYLRRLDRQQRMETVRSLSWGAAGSKQFAGKPMESNAVTEKEGFEPSMGETPHSEPHGSHREIPAPVAKRLQELRTRAREPRHHSR